MSRKAIRFTCGPYAGPYWLIYLAQTPDPPNAIGAHPWPDSTGDKLPAIGPDARSGAHHETATSATKLPFADGRARQPLFDNPQRTDWANEILCAYYGGEFLYTQRMVITDRLKYVFNGFDSDELYDLAADPDELHNRVNDASYRGQVNEDEGSVVCPDGPGRRSIRRGRDDGARRGRTAKSLRCAAIPAPAESRLTPPILSSRRPGRKSVTAVNATSVVRCAEPLARGGRARCSRRSAGSLTRCLSMRSYEALLAAACDLAVCRAQTPRT